MENNQINLIDVDNLVKQFLKNREQGIITLHNYYFKNDRSLSLNSLIESLKDELRTGCVSFINKGSPLEELDNYLFYIANAVCKKQVKPKTIKKVDYVCPGCLFLDKSTIITFNKVFICDECSFECKNTSDPKKKYFLETFMKHNKNGYRCKDCERFIPHPLDNSYNVSCPYIDCLYSGPISNLHKMNHPNIKTNPERLILDSSKDNSFSMKDNIQSNCISALNKIEIEESLIERFEIIKDIIETQKNNVIYNSADFTSKHKQCVYQAFMNLLEKYPEDMTSYLLKDSSNYCGFQHKIFQEYINLLELDLPFFITKNHKKYKIDSLLDNSLCLFDGISTFESVINDKLKIKNGTKEFYIGGRKASYTKPYYIGKLLSVINSETKESILHLVKEYSFLNIHMRDIEPYTKVVVTHLRVPPHHQMGGMVHVNRIRKKIVDRAVFLIGNQ